MGAAESKNVQKTITKAIASVSSKIIQSSTLSTDSSQLISVKNIHGDVHITGNRFKQMANINMKSLLRALSTEEAQQDLLTEVEQSAKSFASGINIGHYTNAQNLMNLLVTATISMVSVIESTCTVFTKENQEIIVDRVEGNVFIQNNVLDQMTAIVQNCIEKATTSSEAFQTLTDELKQAASAKSEGISGWILVALTAIVIGLPVLGGVIGGVYVLKFIFPIIFIVGAVLLVLYFTWTAKSMNVIGYSNGIEQICGIPPSFSAPAPTSGEAQQMCATDETCIGYDWVSHQSNGAFTPQQPKINLYADIPPSCITSLKQSQPDNSPVTRVPNFFKGITQPTTIAGAIPGDVHLNTHSGDWFKLNIQNEWAQQGNFVHGLMRAMGQPMDWGSQYPSAPENGLLFALYNATNPTTFHVKRFYHDSWHDFLTLNGPGLVPAARNPNVTGYKTNKKRDWALYGGIAGIIVGVIGSIYMWLIKDEKN